MSLRFAPRTPLSHASSSRAHSLVASRLWRHAPSLHASVNLGISSVRCRSVTILYTKTGVFGCPCLRFSPASAVCGLRSRLASVSLRRHAPSPALAPPLSHPGPLPRTAPAPPLFCRNTEPYANSRPHIFYEQTADSYHNHPPHHRIHRRRRRRIRRIPAHFIRNA